MALGAPPVEIAWLVVTTAATIGVLALQGDVREHVHALEAVGATAVPVKLESELHGIQGIVLPGGESTVIDKLLRSFGLFEPLRDRLRGGLPAYGSCAGMILLADRVTDATADQQTLGGIDMTVRRNAFGRQVDSFEQDVRYAAWPAAGPCHFRGAREVTSGPCERRTAGV